MVKVTNCNTYAYIDIRESTICYIRAQLGRRLTAWIGELESTKADIVESFVVKDHALISIFNQLVYREGGIVRLNHCIRNFRRGKY
jgi:hypothetical protein